MIDSGRHRIRSVCIVLGFAGLASCSRSEDRVAAPSTAPDIGPVAVASPTPEAVRAADDSAAAVTPAGRLVKAEAGQRVEREEDYYPPATQREPEFMKDMQAPYTHLGPTESRYFSGKFVDGDVTSKALRKRDFDGLVFELQSEGAGDSATRTREYGTAIQRSLQLHAERAQLGRFGCGKLLCMGSISTPRPDWVSRWSAGLRDQPLPIPSLALDTVRTAPDRYEVRFAFTTSGRGGFSTRTR